VIKEHSHYNRWSCQSNTEFRLKPKLPL